MCLHHADPCGIAAGSSSSGCTKPHQDLATHGGPKSPTRGIASRGSSRAVFLSSSFLPPFPCPAPFFHLFHLFISRLQSLLLLHHTMTLSMGKADTALLFSLEHPSTSTSNPENRGNSPICSWWLWVPGRALGGGSRVQALNSR